MAHGKIRVNTLTYDTGSGDVDVAVSSIPSTTALNAKADLLNPNFSGTPTAPTAGAGTNTTQLATTAFVQAANAALVDSAPGTLDTLNELAAALGDDANFSTTVTTSLAGKANTNGTTFTGDVVFDEGINIERVKEKATIIPNSGGGTIPFDVKTQAVYWLQGNTISDYTFNIRGDGSTTLDSIMSTGQVMTVVGIVQYGSTPYKLAGVQVDGTTANVTVRYVGGAPSSAGTANAIVTTTISVIKTASGTFTALVSQAEYEA